MREKQGNICSEHFVLLLSVYNYGIVTNKGYLKAHLAYEHVYAYGERLISRIENTDGFAKDSSVEFIGSPEFIDLTPELSTVQLTGLNDSREILQGDSFTIFIERYLQFPNAIIKRNQETIPDGIIQNKVEAMSSYPDDGSIQMIDNVIYVKF